MRSVLILAFIFSFNCAWAKKKISQKKLAESKKVLQTLLPFQKHQGAPNFSIEKCKTDKSKWMLLLVTKQPFTEKITFDKGCDIQGQYTAKMAVPFPVSLKLKNLKEFNHVNFNFLIQLTYEPVPMIKIFMQNGKLKGKKDSLTFDLEYAAEIDPLSKEFIKKDKGGKITIHTFNGKKIEQQLPIKK